MEGPAIEVRLPAGLWRDGRRHNMAVVRAPELGDELPRRGGLPAERATRLVADCVERIGEIAPVGLDEARELTVGDREAITLHVRRLVAGEELRCVLDCPNANCGERLEVTLRVSDLLVEPYEWERPLHERELGGRCVLFRVPNGGDVERAASHAGGGVDAAARELLEGCVESLDSGELDAELAAALSALMEELDPQADISLSFACPECDAEGAVSFDAAAYVLEELAQHERSLEREVHLLAFHYHWSEAEIIGMPPERRGRYLGLLDDELRGRVA
jgi:hypothetical protein